MHITGSTFLSSVSVAVLIGNLIHAYWRSRHQHVQEAAATQATATATAIQVETLKDERVQQFIDLAYQAAEEARKRAEALMAEMAALKESIVTLQAVVAQRDALISEKSIRIYQLETALRAAGGTA